jgi:hypothetical protein
MALIAGILVASILDPVLWLCLAAAVAAAYLSPPLLWFAIAAVVGGIARWSIASTNRIAVGAEDIAWSTAMGVATLVLMFIAFAVASVVRRLGRRGV